MHLFVLYDASVSLILIIMLLTFRTMSSKQRKFCSWLGASRWQNRRTETRWW